jgi:hypothetical protein
MKTKIYTQAEVSKIKVDEYNKGVNEAIIAMAQIYTLILLDKWGWSGDKAIKLADEVNEEYSMIRNGYLSLVDVETTLWEEYGIKFE